MFFSKHVKRPIFTYPKPSFGIILEPKDQVPPRIYSRHTSSDPTGHMPRNLESSISVLRMSNLVKLGIKAIL
jgi:hypothetical protein